MNWMEEKENIETDLENVSNESLINKDDGDESPSNISIDDELDQSQNENEPESEILEELIQKELIKAKKLDPRPIYQQILLTFAFILGPLSLLFCVVQVYIILNAKLLGDDSELFYVPFYRELNNFFLPFIPLGEFTTFFVVSIITGLYIFIAYLASKRY
jgi:hypothetical protein